MISVNIAIQKKSLEQEISLRFRKQRIFDVLVNMLHHASSDT